MLGGNYTFNSCSQTPISEGEELFLKYGAHANRTLFVSYGFVNRFAEGSISRGDFEGEVEVDDLVVELLRRRGSLGEWIKQELIAENYWGEWTLHSSSPPAHPSYRLITALRLLACFNDATKSPPAEPENTLDKWRKVTSGYEDIISPENEKRWKNQLREICVRVALRAQGQLEVIRRESNDEQMADWYPWARDNVRSLWQEELEVAENVIESIDSDEEL